MDEIPGGFWGRILSDSLGGDTSVKQGNLVGGQVRSFTWLSVPVIQHVCTLGEARSVIYREVNQEKREA